MQTETKRYVTDPQESLGGLLGDLMKHSTALIKGEIALIRAELRSKVDIFLSAAAMTVIGLVLIVLACMAFLAAGIIALAAYIGLVASALICGGVVGVIAAVLVSMGVVHFKQLTI